jgi:hypothetical protein
VESCTTCSGSLREDCSVGVCAAGYHSFVDGDDSTTICSACTGQDNCDTDTANTCLSSGATDKLECTTAVAGYFVDSGVVAACNDFSGEASVESCTTCSGADIADCSVGVCAAGYHSFVDGDDSTTICSGSCFDFSGEASVGSCTTCSGSLREDCSVGVCAAGYHSFVDGDDDSTTICSGSCFDFSGVASVSSCTTCSGDAQADCSVGVCAAGYHSFVDGDDDSTTICSDCTSQTGCTAAGGTCSDVAGLEDKLICTALGAQPGYSVDSDGTVTQDAGRRQLQSSTDGSACTACTAVAGAESITCTTNSDSRAVCSSGYTKTDNSANFAADSCTAIASNCANNYNGGGTAFASSRCTSAGMFIKASLPTSSCAAATCTTTECCDACDEVANAQSITCSAAGNTVPVCNSGYFCAGGSTCNAGDTCTACTAVDNAVSVTCSAAGNSRATCRTGTTLTDNSGSSSSDVCTLPARNCATNWVRCKFWSDRIAREPVAVV